MIPPEEGLSLVDWSLAVVLPLALDSLPATVQRDGLRVLARKVDEEVEEVLVEGVKLSFEEQQLEEQRRGLHPPCRFCCRSSPCLVWDPG